MSDFDINTMTAAQRLELGTCLDLLVKHLLPRLVGGSPSDGREIRAEIRRVARGSDLVVKLQCVDYSY